MLVKEVREIARRWVTDEGSKTPGFGGAFFIGSMTGRADDEPAPATSDVDISLVIDGDGRPANPGRIRRDGVTLEVSLIRRERVADPQAVLGNYAFAWNFASPNIIADPSGRLAEVQAAVAREFNRRSWVLRRRDDAKAWWLASIGRFSDQGPLHEQVFGWLYALSIANHVVLVADLRNPTVRRSWVASKQVLEKYGHGALYETLLGLLGSAHLSRAQVEALLSGCADTFATARTVIKTPFFFSQHITDTQPIAIEGAQEIIEDGYHREAVMWIAIIHTWCQKALFNDAPAEVQDRYAPAYQRLLDALGITAPGDLRRRVDEVAAIVPQVVAVTDEIIAANPAIVD